MSEREHFDSSLGAWTAALDGTWTAPVADSCVTLTADGTVGGAFIYRALPHTVDHIFAACVRSEQSNPSPRLRIFDKATAPAHGSLGTEAFSIDFYVGSASRARFNYFAVTTGTQNVWNDGTKAWGTTTSVNSVPNVQQGDSHIIGYQWDATNARVRFFLINVSSGTTQTEACGPKLFGLTDWVNHSAIRGGGSSTLWMIIGHPNNGNSATGTSTIEWTRFDTGPKILAATNQAPTLSAYRTKLWESFGGRFWLPSGAAPQRTAEITFPGLQAWCANSTQFGAGIEEENGDLWLFFNGKATGGGGNSVGVTKSTDGGLTWTPYSSNPIITDGGGANLAHMGVVKDMLEPDASKRYKLIVTAQAGGDEEIRLYTAAQPDTTSWTLEGTIAAPDGDSATGYGGSHMNPIHFNGEWLLFSVGGGAASGEWMWRGPRLTVADMKKQAFPTNMGGNNVSQGVASISSTSRNVTLASSSAGFVPDALVAIDDDTSNADGAINRVRKVIDADEIELYHRTPGYTGGGNTTINQANAWRVSIHGIRYDKERREWNWYISLFGPFFFHDNGGVVDMFLETTGLAVSPSPLVAPTIDWFECPQMWLARDNNNRSSENPKFFDKPVYGDLLHGHPKRSPRTRRALLR